MFSQPDSSTLEIFFTRIDFIVWIVEWSEIYGEETETVKDISVRKLPIKIYWYRESNIKCTYTKTIVVFLEYKNITM